MNKGGVYAHAACGKGLGKTGQVVIGDAGDGKINGSCLHMEASPCDPMPLAAQEAVIGRRAVTGNDPYLLISADTVLDGAKEVQKPHIHRLDLIGVMTAEQVIQPINGPLVIGAVRVILDFKGFAGMGVEHVKYSFLVLCRQRIAERLLQSQQQSVTLTTFNEVNMAPVMELRREHRASFEKEHGVKLGFMSFFVKATIDALKQLPAVNAEVRGADIVYRNYYDIGIAIGSGRGLVVPVLRNAERLSFAEIEIAISDFARRAQENKLKPDELQGGTFTISNGGVYGSLLSTPIVNPPQSGVLGMHAIQERPVARDGQVVIRPMMYVALTYDHRLVDGREAVTFLKRIKETIENPARMLIEV